MHRARRRKRRIGEIPIDDYGQPIAELSAVPTELEIAALRERDAAMAARVGMPTVGAIATNKAGIVWKVDGHTHASSLTTQGQENSELTLYPVVFPQNLSPKLTEFLMEVGRCTPKAIMPLDTLPHQFPKRAHPRGHSVDAISDRYRILVFLDGSDASEAVIAHELAHVWIELVRGIEDYRVLRDTSDSGRYSQVQLLQSFVLDVAVGTVLKEKGFDTSDIEVDKHAALKQMGQAASAGYQPPTKREAVYMASFLASSFLAEHSSTVLCSQTAALVQSQLPDVYRLANLFKDAVQNSPPTCAQSVRSAIDQVLTAAFEYTDGGIDLVSELFEFKPEPCWDHDKFPEWLPGVSVKGKCEVGVAMARLGVASDKGALFERQENGRIKVRFQTPEGGFTPYTELEHVETIPESPEARARRIMEINQMNRKRLDEMSKGPKMPGGQPPQPSGPPLPPGFPPMPGRSYSPGLARFLTQVRLQELLGGEHPYGYANDNPITYTDPSGLAPCADGLDCSKYPHSPGWYDNNQPFKYAIGGALGEKQCKGLDPSILWKLLWCIPARETRDGHPWKNCGKPKKACGPCQIVPGSDKDKICGDLKWQSDLKDHMKCCARILCSCIKAGGGDIVKGCGTYIPAGGTGKDRQGQFEVINEDTNSYDPYFKCCLIRLGWENPSQIIR